MLKNEAWQPVPGKGEAYVYPIINDATFYLSNAFIVQTPRFIMAIDPGDAGSQIETIRHLLDDLKTDANRQVIVFLTHCHVDHCFEFLSNPSAIAPGCNVLVAIQEDGFKAISLKDRELTGAGRYHKMIPDANLDICLLSAEDRRFNVSKHLRLTDSIALGMAIKTISTSCGNALSVQDISGAGFDLNAYHTPGHSPDSVTFRIGDMLFTGDAMFAADHFISGLPGWSRNDALTSAQNLLWLIENTGISLVAPGHGQVMTSDRAAMKLKKMIAQLSEIVIQKELNVPAILASSEHAMDVAREARDIVAVMADSLSRVAHYLTVLDESCEASRYASAINKTKFENIFTAFNQMVGEMQSGRLVEMGLVVKFSALVVKMRAMLRAEGLETVVGHSLLTRLERMLNDFGEDSTGRPVQLKVEIFQAEAFLRRMIDELKNNVYANKDIIDTVGDERAFVLSLSRRLAFRPIYLNVEFVLTPLNDVWIATDRDRLAEIIEIILECMVESGSRKIILSASKRDQDMIHIILHGESIPGCLLADGYRKRALARRLNWIKGCFRVKNKHDAPRIIVMVPFPTNIRDG